MVQCQNKSGRNVFGQAFAVLIVLMLLAGLGYAQSPAPAGQRIGNIATATYLDENGVPKEVDSNEVVTTVTRIAGVQLEADEQRFAADGELVYFPLTLTNTGNDSDTYNLSAIDDAAGFACTSDSTVFYADNGGTPGAVYAGGQTPSIAAGSDLLLFVGCQIPLGVDPGVQTSLNVTATSTFNATEGTDDVDKLLTVSASSFNVIKRMDPASGDAGATVTVSLEYQNTGSTTEDLIITDDLPPELRYVSGSGEWTFNGATTTLDLTDVATDNDAQSLDGAAIDYQADAAGAPEVTIVLSDVAPGVVGVVQFDITVDADAGAGVIENFAEYENEAGQRNTTAPARYTVVEQFDVILTDATTILNNVSGNFGPVGANQPDEDGVANDVVSIASADQNGVIRFANILRNNGNVSDRYTIVVDEALSTFPAGTRYDLEDIGGAPLVNDNSPLLAPGEQFIVILEVSLPSSATDSVGPFSVSKSAVSQNDAAVNDSVVDQLEVIEAASVDLTNGDPENGNQNSDLGAGAGPEPTPVTSLDAELGETVRFFLYVNNASGASGADYDLSAGSAVDALGNLTSPLPAGWNVSFRVANNVDPSQVTFTQESFQVKNVSPGAVRLVYADVTVPAADSGMVLAGNYPVYFRIESSLLGVADVKYDEVVIAAQPAVVVENQESVTVRPGECVATLHTVVNTGNVVLADGVSSFLSFSVADSNSADFIASRVYRDVVNPSVFDDPDDAAAATSDELVTLAPSTAFNFGGAGLAPGESAEFWLQICAQPGAPDNAVNSVTLSVAIDDDDDLNNGVLQTVTTVDTATVVDSLLTSVKEQAFDADCDGVDVGDFGIAQVQAAPGQCVCYRITATNTDPVTTASRVIISDEVPADTAYSSCVTDACESGVTANPGAGGRGLVRGDFGSLVLQPGQSAAMQFCVEINDVN